MQLKSLLNMQPVSYTQTHLNPDTGRDRSMTNLRAILQNCQTPVTSSGVAPGLHDGGSLPAPALSPWHARMVVGGLKTPHPYYSKCSFISEQ